MLLHGWDWSNKASFDTFHQSNKYQDNIWGRDEMDDCCTFKFDLPFFLSWLKDGFPWLFEFDVDRSKINPKLEPMPIYIYIYLFI